MNEKDYPPEVYELLAWFEAHPGGLWADVPQQLWDYGWDIVRDSNLHDGTTTHHSTPGLSGFGRHFLREHRRELKAENGEQPAVGANVVEILLGEEDREILSIVRSDKSCDDKMRAICGLDRRYLAWTSPKWSELLGRSDVAIRKTQFWKTDRPQLIEAGR